MKVAFIHPDLGIGGAERLVVDSALAMKRLGHEVVIYTSHHDKKHCFEETRDGSLKVVVLGDSIIPRNIVGKLAIMCAIGRQLHLALQLVHRSQRPDLFIIDQLPAAIPYLRTSMPGARILFYCHHPDLLLTERKTLAKKLYRLPFDAFERWSTSLADQVVVNSKYTREVYTKTFGEDLPTPSVVYPVVEPEGAPVIVDPVFEHFPGRILLSINRFERKKNIELALEAYSLLLHLVPRARQHLLVIAGGYDTRVLENIEYLEELKRLATKFRLPAETILPGGDLRGLDLSKLSVVFLPSVSSPLKNYLLKRSSALLYTPTNEHFGIVPLEAMRAGTPVLATNTGGPLETIDDNVTGWLRPSDAEDWYRVIRRVLLDMSDDELHAMGVKGQEVVAARFSPDNLAEDLDIVAKKTLASSRPNEEAVAKRCRLVGYSSIFGAIVLPILAVWFLIRLYAFMQWFIPVLLESTQW